MNNTLFQSTEGAELQYLSVEKLHPHPNNPRIEYDWETVQGIAHTLKKSGEFDESHALLVRPNDDGYEIVSGHHRWEAAKQAGLEEVPVWVRPMNDTTAHMKLVTENNQSELSRLEIGLHALETVGRGKRGRGNSGDGLKAYAERVGVERKSLTEWVSAAEVYKSVPRGNLLGQSVRALYEISKAPERFWEPLAEALVGKEWSVRETRKQRKKVEDFDIPDRWADVFLDPASVISEFLRSTEGFSPQTVARLAEQADQTVSLIKSRDVNQEKWLRLYKNWLSTNAGPNGRQQRPYRKDAWRKRGLRNKHKELKAKLEEAEQERKWSWHLGSFEEYVEQLQDGSVRLLLTDPPYGMEYQSNHNDLDLSSIRGDDEKALPLLRSALEQMVPKLQEDAHVLVFAHWRMEPKVRHLISEFFEVRGSLIWAKHEHGLGDLDGSFSPSHERIIHAVKGDPSLAHREKDVIQSAKVKTEDHPTVKPEDLLRPLIRATTVKGELVADPFGGIASTVASALKEKRRAWAVELEEDYHTIGERRIESVNT